MVQSWLTTTSHLPASSDSPASVSKVARIAGTHHPAWLIFFFLVEKGFCYIGQAGLRFLGSRIPPALASQSAGIIGVSLHAQPHNEYFYIEREGD